LIDLITSIRKSIEKDLNTLIDVILATPSVDVDGVSVSGNNTDIASQNGAASVTSPNSTPSGLSRTAKGVLLQIYDIVEGMSVMWSASASASASASDPKPSLTPTPTPTRSSNISSRSC